MENAKKNLVFHFGVGHQASFLKIGYVNSPYWNLQILSYLPKEDNVSNRLVLIPRHKTKTVAKNNKYPLFFNISLARLIKE